MLRLLRLVSVREQRAHWRRAALVVVGVASGVALIVAIDLINASVLGNVRTTLAALAGPSDLEVTLGTGEVGFAEDLIEVVRRDPEVAAAVPLVRGTVAVADVAGETLQLFGAELNAEEDLERYRVRLVSGRRDAVAALTDPHALFVTEAVAARYDVGVGSSLRLATALGVDSFAVRGILAAEGVAAALGGQLVVMDLAAAQTQLAKEGRLDQIDLTLRPGADVSAAADRLATTLPATVMVAPPAARAGRYDDVLGALQTTLSGMSLLCLLAGIFIVYNAAATGAVHRAPTIGALRLIGANATQLFDLLIGEAAVLGAVGAFAGVVGGVVLARIIVSLVGDTLGTMLQLRFVVPALIPEARRYTVAGVLGVAVAVMASAIPAWQATKLEPLDVARGVTVRAAGPPPTRRLIALWIVMAALGAVGLVLGDRWRSGAVATAGSTLWNASGLVLAVPFVVATTGMLERFLRWTFGVEGRVAAANVTRSPIRSGVTVGAIGIMLGIAVTITSLTASYIATTVQFITDLHDTDLAVAAVATEGGWLETALAPGIVDELRAVPGVRAVETARVVPGQSFRGRRIGLLVLAPEKLARTSDVLWRAGDRDRARPALAAGEAVAISTIFSDRFGVHVGDRLELETPKGALVLPVAAVMVDLSSNSGTVILSKPVYEHWWGDVTVNRIGLFLDPGVSTEEVRRRIVARLGERYRLKILDLRGSVAYHEDKVRHAFAFTDAIQMLVVVVAIAGIFDLLLSGILERRHELAVWRLIGATPRSVRRTIMVESGALGALAAVFGLVFGVATSWIWVRRIIPLLIGYDLIHTLPPVPLLTSVSLVLVMTVLAGRAAAVIATRRPVLDGIRTD